MDRRRWGGCGGPRAIRKRPNFLFLIADDHAGYVLGCDGNKQAETPNLDRLASESTRFAMHYCNSPVCTPSRQSPRFDAEMKAACQARLAHEFLEHHKDQPFALWVRRSPRG